LVDGCVAKAKCLKDPPHKPSRARISHGRESIKLEVVWQYRPLFHSKLVDGNVSNYNFVRIHAIHYKDTLNMETQLN